MYVYKMLLINQFREYKCLIRNMLPTVLSLVFIIGIISYQAIVTFVPVLMELTQVNRKGLFYIHVFLLCFSFYCCFIKVKPILIVKPITLYLFHEQRIKRLLRLKMLGKIVKHLVFTFCLSSFVCGFVFDSYFFVVHMLLFCFLQNTALLSWQIYHNRDKNKQYLAKLMWFINGMMVLLSHWFPYTAIVNLMLWIVLIIHSFTVLDINRPKYEAEMVFMEKLLSAQNHNNTVLLSQYMEEKRLFSLSLRHMSVNKAFISKYPLTWKAKTSIYRLDREKIMAGFIIFVITFLIYRYPLFWSLPIIELPGIRYTLLIFGMLTVFQLTMQSMLNQLDSVLEKAKEGLFLPISDKDIIVQFTIIPVIVMNGVLCAISVMVQCSFFQYILAAGMLSAITILLFYLQLKRKKLLRQGYFAVTIVMLIITFLLT